MMIRQRFSESDRVIHQGRILEGAKRSGEGDAPYCFLRLVLAVSVSIAVMLDVLPTFAQGPGTQGQADPRVMQFEPVEFLSPEPERVVLENGMVIYLLEDHELPLVTISAMIRTGGWLDPPDKIGLASLTGTVMRTGGTERMTPEEVDEELEHLAADVSTGIGTTSGGAMLDVLEKDLDRGLQIFADILMRPRFASQRLELAKLQTIESIRRRYDRPQSIARLEFPKLLYGPTHPYARRSSVESISRVTREDLVAFHRRTVHPNGIILGVTGDFETNAMLDLLQKTFGGWARGQVEPVTLPPLDGDHEGRESNGEKVIHFVGKGTTQAHLRVGHLSLKERDPDYPALAIANDILGGSSFRSRLFQDVRTRQGLAYSVGSGLRGGIYERGVWMMYAETKIDSTEQVINSLIMNMQRLREEAVTDAELTEAKEAFVNSFVFSFTSPARIVSRLIGLEYDGLPKDFLQQLRRKVVKLTKEDLLRVSRTHLHPDQLKIFAVGSPERLPKALGRIGEIKEVQLE